MKTRFRIVPPTGVTPTNMRIKRATTKAGLAAATYIYQGIYAATFLDTSIAIQGVVWYQVELSTNGTDYSTMPVFSMLYIDDYGAGTESLTSAFAALRRPVARGGATFGVMLGQSRIPIPSTAIVTNWSALVAAGTSVSASAAPLATAVFYENMTVGGEVFYFPVDNEGVFRIGTGAFSAADAETHINTLQAYLNNESTTDNVYTVSGFRYKLVMFTDAQVKAIGSSWLVTPDINTPIQTQASSVGRLSTYFAGATAGQAMNIDNTTSGSTVSYNRPTASVATLYPLVAFKYIGPA